MGIRCQSDWVSAVSDAQLFDDLFELVLSRELPEPPHSLLFSWCTVTSISDTCIVTVSVCVVSVFFLLGAWQSGKKGRKKEKGFVVILPVIFIFFVQRRIHSTLKRCLPSNYCEWSADVCCRHCFLLLLPPLRIELQRRGIHPKHGQQRIPSFVFFLDFYSVVVVVFFFPKKTTEMSALPWRSTWHQMT